MSMSEREVEEAVWRDYESVVGKVVMVSLLLGYKGDNSDEITLEPPVIARIEKTRRDDVVRWNDEEHCDPYYDISILAPHADLEGTRSHWMYGPSRTAEGIVSDVYFTVAPEEMQARYRDAPGLDEDHVGKVDGWVEPKAVRAFTVASPDGPIRVDADLGAVLGHGKCHGDMQRVDVDLLKESLGVDDLEGVEVGFEDVGFWDSRGVFQESERSNAMTP